MMRESFIFNPHTTQHISCHAYLMKTHKTMPIAFPPLLIIQRLNNLHYLK